ncbi:MAG: haloacid dehalogenase type II [Burkholderiales bacterium]
MKCTALVFDAYGTLLDVNSVAGSCEKLFPGQGAALSRLWRAKQLEYTWLRSLMGRYEDFAQITADALRHACSALDLKLESPHVLRLMDAYDRLAPFPDAIETLQQLAHCKRAILSNGSPSMLNAAVENAHLAPHLDAILSVDEIRVYKPDPRAYRLAVERLGVAQADIGFVSANYWDAAGAKSFGFSVFWINRRGNRPDVLGSLPDVVVDKLADLPSLVATPA